ncbi:MAG TPA: FAD-dependent oxidoreductase [Ktedonobacteraceae bacterium]|nr:FAD-dependent oxidoreductase [Ktedonobacteraceae bacterium]
MNILIIGCGISGLTTGISLLQAGHSVQAWARDLPPNTTSNIAAAIWYPYKAYPIDKVTAWGKVAFQEFKRLEHSEGCGVFMATIMELKPIPSADPWWVAAVDSFRHANKEELPPGYPDGYIFEAPVIDTRIFLDYLVQTFQAQGGLIIQRSITSLAEAFEHSAIVVNCSGLGACTLVGDHDLHPARGQTIRIKHNGYRMGVVDEEGANKLAYIVPRTSDIILGGTYEEHNESTEIDPEETQAILQRCGRIAPQFPSIRPEDILSVQCGLRPVRSTIRLEAERVAPDRLLLHNYGHGGAGITLSWGCAAAVVELLRAAI